MRNTKKNRESLPVTGTAISLIGGLIANAIFHNIYVTLGMFAVILLSFAFGIWIQETTKIDPVVHENHPQYLSS